MCVKVSFYCSNIQYVLRKCIGKDTGVARAICSDKQASVQASWFNDRQ